MISLTKTRIFLALILFIAGSGVAAYGAGIIQKPDYGLEDRGDWGEVTESSVEIISTGWVHNPNSFKLNISSLDVGYSINMNGVNLAEGGKEGLYIPENDNTTLDVSTELKPEKVPKWWVSHLRNNEESNLKVPINIQLEILGYSIAIDGVSYTDTIETDIESMMNSSVSKLQGEYSYQTVPETVLTSGAETDIEIRDASAKFGEVNSESTRLLVDLTLHNPNDYAVPTPQFNGELLMNQVEVANWQANEVRNLDMEDAKLDPDETREVRFEADIDNSKMDEWFVSHAVNSEQTDGEMNVRLGLNLFGTTVTAPPGGIECSFSFQTGILEDNQESSNEFEGCQQGLLDSGGSQEDDNQDSNSEDGSDGGLIDGGILY